MTPETEFGYGAIRSSVALAEEPDLRCLQLTGDTALDALDAVVPCDVFLQDGQMKHTLLLRENAVPFADVYACREGEDAYILGYGPDADELMMWISSQVKTADVSMVDVRASHVSFAIDGPYAWEFCAEAINPDILALPYLAMMVLDDLLVFRAGRTGEYGYHVLVPLDRKDEWIERLDTAGAAFEAVWADEESRAQCVLENFFFDLEREGRHGLTPMELQLQWRLSRQKSDYPGAAAVRARRESGWDRRMTCFVAPAQVHPQDDIRCDGESVGHVLVAGFSPVRQEYVGKALMQRPYWHAGLEGLQASGHPIKTVSAPTIKNLSLRVNPYRHSFHTREEDLL